MTDKQLFIDKYNERNDEFSIVSYNDKIQQFSVRHIGHDYKIDFYEFIFNPKYKVLEVFGKYPERFMNYDRKSYGMKQPKQIIKYIASQLKGKE